MAYNYLLNKLCPWCATKNSTTLFSFYPPDLAPEPFELCHCLNCSSYFPYPRPDLESTLKFFKRPKLWLNTATQRRQSKREFLGYIKALQLAKGSKILDIGCGDGYFLEAFGPDYEKWGVELNFVAVKIARRHSPASNFIRGDFLEDQGLPKGFDLIIMNRTLDHFQKPKLALTKALNLLSPQGILFLGGLINPDSLVAKLFKKDFRLWHPWHQVYLPPRKFKEELAELGYEVFKIDYPYLKTPYFSTPEGLKSLWRIGAKVLNPAKPALSPPFWGNLYNLWLKPTAPRHF